MAFAADNDLTVLTLDLDFGILLAQSGQALRSVVQLRTKDVLPPLIDERVVLLLRLRQELKAGALVTIDPKKARVSVLPLNREE